MYLVEQALQGGKKEMVFLLTYLLMGAMGFSGHVAWWGVESVPQRKPAIWEHLNYTSHNAPL